MIHDLCSRCQYLRKSIVRASPPLCDGCHSEVEAKRKTLLETKLERLKAIWDKENITE